MNPSTIDGRQHHQWTPATSTHANTLGAAAAPRNPALGAGRGRNSPMLAFPMPSSFTRDDIARIAALANLELEPGEVDLFARQLAEILAYAEQVQLVDTSGIPPTAAVGARHRADRGDDVRPSLPVEAVLANAPDADSEAGLFKVPRVL
jgi:aspartyl-tRNA(Asn)/glutamyl-tRNA(Gln) amidotransferase subunit C